MRMTVTLANSDGCNENEPMPIQREAPYAPWPMLDAKIASSMTTVRTQTPVRIEPDHVW